MKIIKLFWKLQFISRMIFMYSRNFMFEFINHQMMYRFFYFYTFEIVSTEYHLKRIFNLYIFWGYIGMRTMLCTGMIFFLIQNTLIKSKIILVQLLHKKCSKLFDRRHWHCGASSNGALVLNTIFTIKYF